MFSSLKKKHSKPPSTSSQVTEKRQFPTNSQSHLLSRQEKQQSQHVSPWSAHDAPSFGQSPSPFPRHYYALSTTATAAGELYLFGGFARTAKSPNSDLYVISTRDFSTTFVQTSGGVPNPRYGHRVVLSGTTLLIWGGMADCSNHTAQTQIDDDSVYLLNLVSREWTRIVVYGPGPGRRYYHTMTLVGSKLFVFGGRTDKSVLNDMWALDLNRLKSNPFWESYEPAPGNEKPLPRFGGRNAPHGFNDTWAFNISTRKWTELQCTGSIPSPRASHAAVLVDDVMYVFGGRANDGTYLGDLTALNLSTQRWAVFQDIGPSPCGRAGHAMACDGTRVFVLGGKFSLHAQVDEAKHIHVLDTKLLIYPKPDSNTVKHSEKTTQLAQKLSAGHPTKGQPQHRTISSSDAGATHGSSPFQIATSDSEDMGRASSPQITRERNPSLNSLPSRPTGASDRPRRVPEEDGGDDVSVEHHGKLVAPDAGKEIARSDDGRLIELERQLSEMLVAKTERDRRIAQLTDELALKSALLEQAEANAAEEKKRAGLGLRELQVKLDESLLSRDQALKQAQSALQKPIFWGQPACEHEMELAEVYAKLDGSESELATVRLQLTDAEDGWAKSKAEADTLRTGTQAAAGLVNMDVDRVMRRLMERVRSVEAEMDSLRGNEKSIESMECRNEG